MLSKRVITIARSRALFASRYAPGSALFMSKGWNAAASHATRAQFHSSHLLQAETVKVPQMAESISEGTLRSWSKQVGDTVEVDEEVATIETDKIDVTVNAPMSGTIVELLANEEDTVSVGQDLFRIEASDGAAITPKQQATTEEPKELSDSSKKADAEEPKDQQVEKAAPPPPTPSEADKKSAPQVPKESKKESKPAVAAPPKAPGSRNETRVKMNRMRLRIAERLKESQNIAASLTTFNEIDMSSLMEMRKKYKDEVLKEHDVKLGFMSAFARACTLALQEIPAANASIEGEEIVYRDYVDLSVAVATPKGLVTPVVRNVEGMGFLAIEKEIAALGKKARDSKLTLEDMAGGTFTISNGGVFGSLYGTPIINLPQSAVLGMHAIKEKPVVVNGQIVIRPIMVVALTYDHRLLDGREAVTFLVKVRDYIEDPRKMLLAP
ncbi:dihydrolipoamide succinyltransferase [Gyrodon lividus]|nr:dihydrolipoamide succinyltransferase [Gyrodon lividus]